MSEIINPLLDPETCPNCASLEAENTRLRGLVEKAFDAGWQARGDACYPTPMEFERPLAWRRFAFREREGLALKGESNE